MGVWHVEVIQDFLKVGGQKVWRVSRSSSKSGMTAQVQFYLWAESLVPLEHELSQSARMLQNQKKGEVRGRYHQQGVGSDPTHGIPLISVHEQSVPLSLGSG